MGATARTRALRAGLLVGAAALVGWVHLLPLSLTALDDEATQEERGEVARRVAGDVPQTLAGPERRIAIQHAVEQWIDSHQAQFDTARAERAARLKAALSYRGADGRDHVYLGDYDSYTWLRSARNYLRGGTTCDAMIDGVCHDTYANAPVGRRDQYHRSLHIAAIIGVHRLMTMFSPGQPLPASAFLVPAVVGILGVFPAFFIGCRLGGELAGWAAAVLIGGNAIFLQRSLGSDNDVWNLVLPLYMMWAATNALATSALRRRILYALLAAVFAVAHAATWRGWLFTYAVLVVSLLCNIAVGALRHIVRARDARVWRDAAFRSGIVVLAIVIVGTGLLNALAGGEEDSLHLIFTSVTDLWRGLGTTTTAAVVSTAQWPDALSTVAELSRPDLATIAAYMGGPLVFFAGWLGLLVLVLPRRSWQWWHFVVLIGGNYLYRYLLTAKELGRSMLIALLAAPLAVAIALFVVADDGEAENDRGAALTMVVWFIAALFLSFNGLRFVMLLVPPFAIACAVALGRLHAWLVGRIAAIDVRYATVAAPLLFIVLAALILPPLREGYDTARNYRPRINGAWWQALEKVRDQTPADAIVTTWWDYGYWVKYVAERRVSADGGSLQTHVPYWIGRALIATDERETVGLLRMLDCASDATPEPEGTAGAFGLLIASGMSTPAAHAAVLRLAGLDAPAARAYLAEIGVPADDAAAVLAASHCQLPPAYLVLSSELITQRAWRVLGGWDPVAANAHPPPDREPLLHWHRCQDGGGENEMTCPVGVAIASDGTRLEEVVYRPQQPEATRLHLERPHRDAPADVFEQAPVLLLVAGDTELRSFPSPGSSYPDIGVLIDTVDRRVLVATPDLLRSTFTQLLLLDGRYARHFEKFDDRAGLHGERVVTWRIDWDGRATPAVP